MPTVYRSTDTNAPTLNASAGSFKTVITQVLVSGYTGKDPAGWTLAYEDGNTFVLRNDNATGSGAYFRFDDSVGIWARVRAYSAMSDVNTGDDPAPTVSDYANGVPILKSRSGTASWIIYADDRTCYIQVEGTDLQGFGDFDSWVAADAFPYFIAGIRDTENTARGPGWAIAGANQFGSPSTGRGSVLGMSWDQSTGPVEFSVPVLGYTGTTSNNVLSNEVGGVGGMDEPDPSTGVRMFTPALVAAEGALRGRFRGLYAPLNNLGSVANETVENAPTGAPVGSRLVILKSIPFTGSRTSGAFAVETDLAW